MVDLELEYTPSSRVDGGSAPFVAAYRERSAAAREALGDSIVHVPGGSLLIAPDTSSPLLVFVHGGYWQALSAAESLYLAPGARSLGWSYAAIEYTLAPEAGIEQMVSEVRDSLRSLGALVSPSSVVLAGHSAGGHLVAMAALVEPAPLRIDRVVLVSGVFDLRPLVHTTVNDPLGMDDERAASLSPLLLPVGGSVRDVIVTVGDNETDAFKTQSSRYAAHVRAARLAVTEIESHPRHHFDIVDDLVDPSTALGARTIGGLQ
jgi:arylformamidase